MQRDEIVIYHNPRCGTSRNVLAAIRAAGIEPVIIEYLKTPPDRATLARLAKAMAEPIRAMVREKEPQFAALDLADADDGRLLDAIVAHPILLNRPIVVTATEARLCRPWEVVQEVLARLGR